MSGTYVGGSAVTAMIFLAPWWMVEASHSPLPSMSALYQEEENFANNNVVEMVSKPGSKCSAIREDKKQSELFGMK